MNLEVLCRLIKLFRHDPVEIEIFLCRKRCRHSSLLIVKPRLDVVIENCDEFRTDAGTLKCGHETSIDIDWRLRLLTRSWQRYSDMGVLRLAWSVHDASHNGDFEIFNTRIRYFPRDHAGIQVFLDIAGHFLKHGARCPSA